ncbi:MAG: DUF309 domain-containing protein [Chloroflexi bacterium]|nr:DUF309 domain-containing protein [Chloroflexota bacterium]
MPEPAPPERRSHKERGKPEIRKIGRGLPSGKCAEPPSAAFLHGLREFNAGLYFEQHETLEAIWVAETDPVRYLYQGILQIGVGLYHQSRGNGRGALALMERGIRALEPFRPACSGVDVDRLIVDATRCREALVALGPERTAELDPALAPRVRLLPGVPGAEAVQQADRRGEPHESAS